ncbi:MAG: hypothetical protein E7645_06155 [Ruminococcaceae bacterium]|nr:hypothetical protein [Oscillospiraceae bacterium]
MKQKIASFLIKISAIVTVLALAVMILGPVTHLEFPRVSLWSLIYAVMALWAYSPEIRPIRELWIFGIARIIITAWELIEMRFFTETVHPATQAGLWILLVGTALYVAGLALWRDPEANETETKAENESAE